VDALGSRQLLLYLFPELCIVPSAIKPLSESQTKRFRALDVGAGIGRVTRDVLLHLVHDVVLVEPVEKYVNEAWARGKYHQDSSPMPVSDSEAVSFESQDFRTKWKGVQERKTSVTFIQATHQSLNPCHPLTSTKLVGRIGYIPPGDIMDDLDDSGFDIIWCQWSLGHLTNPDLVSFLRRAKAALRDENSVIVVKENLCTEAEGDDQGVVFDDQDSSLTRSSSLFVCFFTVQRLLIIN
jgi:protein N-terminal methyltransferase